jgi:K+-sensing histidine kinase KdpD
MEDLSLHVLDVAENALAAGAGRVDVRLIEDSAGDALRLEIEDDGHGMDKVTAARALDPFYTSKSSKRVSVGLGLPLLAQAAREAGGEMELRTAPGKGTLVGATFQRSHPDLKPTGDMLQTMAILACAHPHVRFAYQHLRDGILLFQWTSGSEESARK